jgi:hypothetical protein
MDERRKVQRHRTLKAGTIALHGDSGFDCRVRNLSPAGACLEVASQVGIPDDFVLMVEVDHFKSPCHVIWRTATRLGVEFNAQEQAVPSPAAAGSAA